MAANKNEGVSSIIKDLMHELGFSNVREFSEELGCNYMMLYYHFSGKNNVMSTELSKKILARYPNVRPQFIMRGEYPIFKGQEPEMPQSFGKTDATITSAEMFSLLDRITILLEKVQAREEYLDQKIAKVEELERELLEKSKKTEIQN